MRFVKLHIFTQSGATYTFSHGEIVLANESALVFNYEAGSDGQTKRGTFWVKQMSGYSVLEKYSNKIEK